jgi:pyrophosphate--fructose-6-phosphate 1-phosphotransferase
MIGFLDGPQGIYNGQYCIVNDHFMDCYRNSGGFDMIASGRHKIEKPEEFANAMANCIELNLDGLVVIGGDDSNTNAAVLAEYFEAHGCKTKVCGAPKTIDGDLKVGIVITSASITLKDDANCNHNSNCTSLYYHCIF